MQPLLFHALPAAMLALSAAAHAQPPSAGSGAPIRTAAVAPMFRFGPALVAAPQETRGAEDESRLLTRIEPADGAQAAARRERPYARACNFTTACR